MKGGGGGAGASGTSGTGSGEPTKTTGSLSATAWPVLVPSGPLAVSLLPSAIFDVRAVRSGHRRLTLSGEISNAATGTISLQEQASLTRKRIWTRKLTLSIHDGRFKLRMRLPKSVAKRPILLRLLYLGDSRHRAATATLTVRR
jgi:hypothetical protein